jgi:hypothetical protein
MVQISVVLNPPLAGAKNLKPLATINKSILGRPEEKSAKPEKHREQEDTEGTGQKMISKIGFGSHRMTE